MWQDLVDDINGLMSSGNKLLLDPMLVKLYQASQKGKQKNKQSTWSQSPH